LFDQVEAISASRGRTAVSVMVRTALVTETDKAAIEMMGTADLVSRR
jgi:hypothetical protein